jgi:phenylacetate-CoA ligase
MLKKEIYTLLTVIDGLDSRGILKRIENVGSQENLFQFQREQLRSLILHAYKKVGYYRAIFDKIRLVQANEVDLSRFSEIPILTKEIIRQNSETLRSEDYKKRRWFFDYSGGSTGEPVKLIQDYDYRRWGDATFNYWYKDMLGIDEISVRKIVLWGSVRDLIKGKADLKSRLADWSKNTLFLDSYQMTEGDIVRYIKAINTFKPDLIRGYSGSLYELCRYAQKKKIKLFRPKVVVSAADMLFPEMRACIEEVFEEKIFNFYGSREANSLAGECKEGLLHILGFHNYVEVLDKDNHEVKEGVEGKVIITNLHNYSMPMIRYDIGDMAKLGPQRCACGNILPTLQEIKGRIVEHFIKEDGTLISPHSFSYRLRQLEWVKEYQVVQEGYKEIKFLIVPRGVVTEGDKKGIEEKTRSLLGIDCKIEWVFVREIPKTPQGKYRYLTSLINN